MPAGLPVFVNDHEYMCADAVTTPLLTTLCLDWLLAQAL